jgi:Fe-Mn family superoxide dismutase
MPFELPKLSYELNALEPYIDAKTMDIHLNKHHQTYVTNLNTALSGTGLENKSIENLLQNLSQVPEEKRTAVRNNGGGHANHSLFWKILSPKGKTEPRGELEIAINRTFGSVENFKEKFEIEAKNRFGSGWAWLTTNKNEELEVFSLPNQDSPIMEGKIPLIGLDLWEHAYYLNYQNRRPDYISAFWNIVHWPVVSEIFLSH